MATKKKITEVGSSQKRETTPESPSRGGTPFVATPQSKKKARSQRIIATALWALAIAAQIIAISMLFNPPVNMTWLITLIIIDLALVAGGALIWKGSNKLDPASKEDGLRFFIQNQLGMVTAVIAFVPLIIFILGSKNLDGKQKGILGGVAGAALAIAAIVGIDFNPPSIEQYTEEKNRVEWLNEGRDFVYWTKSGSVYHIFDDCPYINTSKTTEIFKGSVNDAHEMKNITRLCSRCDTRAISEQKLNETDFIPETSE